MQNNDVFSLFVKRVTFPAFPTSTFPFSLPLSLSEHAHIAIVEGTFPVPSKHWFLRRDYALAERTVWKLLPNLMLLYN